MTLKKCHKTVVDMIPFRCGNGNQLAPVSNRLALNENKNTLSTPVGREPKNLLPWLSGASSCKPFDPDRHFLPCADSYHSRRVIARSVSRRRYGGKFRALARATSASLTTRIPKAFELSSGGTTSLQGGLEPNRIRLAPLLNSEALGRVGARAVSDNRTYRRLETEQRKSYELRGNRGSKLKQNFQNHFEGKSWSVTESWGNSFLSQYSGGLSL